MLIILSNSEWEWELDIVKIKKMDPDLFRQGPDLQKIHKVALVN